MGTDAVVSVDKPLGMSSQEAVTRVKRALAVKKAGHAGTLDPLATGVLVVGVGRATRLMQYLMDLPKVYLARMQLGVRTDTQDSEGSEVDRAPWGRVTREAVEGALEGFRGPIMQVPPMYSALKREGRPLYEIARAGGEVVRDARPVTVYALDLVAFDPPFVDIRLRCSKGTYVRTICDDLGVLLGTYAHMTALCREAVGHFSLDGSVALERLREDRGGAGLYTMDEALCHLGRVVFDPDDYRRLINGMPVNTGKYGENISTGPLRFVDSGGVLFAIGEVSGGRLRAKCVLATDKT